MEKGTAEPKNYTDIDGWKRGDLDFFTIPQDWESYTDEEHKIWKDLYKRQIDILPGRATNRFLECLNILKISENKIPNIDELNEILSTRTGWKIVTVPGLIPDEPFFELLANRRFPTGQFIRTREQFDYIQEPDIFHDVFGHVPLLADPIFADYIESYGRGGLKAANLGAIDMLSRLYWYTVEFGLIQTEEGMRIYGAGILSSPTEAIFSLESDSPNRIKFNLERILRTHYHIDDFQDNYFAIDSFAQLFEETRPDFTPIYKRVKEQEIILPGDTVENDILITEGTGEYAKEAAIRRTERAKEKNA